MLETKISVCSSVTLKGPPLDFKMGWTGELWWKTKGGAGGKSREAVLPIQGKPCPSQLFYLDLHYIQYISIAFKNGGDMRSRFFFHAKLGPLLRQNSKFVMRGTSQSATEYSLLLKKLPTVNKKSWPPPKLGPKKTVSIIAFRITLTLDVTIVWLGRHLTVCVQKRHKNAIFGCSRFQKFNFDCFLLKLLICSPTTENIFTFVCPCWLSHLSWFQGHKYIPPSFWLWVTNHDFKSKNSKKWFLRSLPFYTNFSWCWKVEEET